MSLERPYTPRDYLGEEGDAVPAPFAPRPLTSNPEFADSHPLLDISLTPERGGGILRGESAERQPGRRRVRFDVNQWSESGKSLSPEAPPLSVPTMHSSAALGLEAEREAERGFDEQSAVRSELGRSYRARRSVEGEAARALNVGRARGLVGRARGLYQGLVSLEPSAEQLQRLTERERQRSTERREVSGAAGPDLLVLSDPSDRYTETPYLSVEGLPPLTHRPRLRPPCSAFDMHRKLREWAS